MLIAILRNLFPDTSNDDNVVYIDSRLELLPNWRELWASRELLAFLVWRDIKVRYKQTLAGASWAVIQPFITMVVFTIFFGRVVRVPSNDIPYPIFSYAALVPWTLFSQSLSMSTVSIVANSNLVRKVYFPKIILPVSVTLGRVVDFFFSMLVLLGMIFAFGYTPKLAALWVVPVLAFMSLMLAQGIGLWLASINVRFRDIGQLVPFLVQLWMFATPVIYPATLLTESQRNLYALNPMTTVIEGFRHVLVQTESPDTMPIIISIAVTIVVFISGVLFFQRKQATFVDIL